MKHFNFFSRLAGLALAGLTSILAAPAPPVLRSPMTTNVTTGVPAASEVPTWDAGNSRWEFVLPPGMGGGEIATMENDGGGVYLTAPKVGTVFHINSITNVDGLVGIASNANLITLSFAQPALYQHTNANLTLLQAYGPAQWQASNANLTLLQAYGPAQWQASNANLTLLQAYGPATWQATNTLTDWSAGNVTFVPIGGDIQTYINAAVAGDTLVLGSGDYPITSTITVNKRLNIVGQGNAGYITIPMTASHGTTISSATAATVAFTVTASNVRIANLGINLTSTTWATGITTAANLTGLMFQNIDVLVLAASTAEGFTIYGSDTMMRGLTFYVRSTNSTASGVWLWNDSSVTQNSTLEAFGVSGYVKGGATFGYGFVAENINDANTVTLNLYNTTCLADTGTVQDVGVASISTTTANSTVNTYLCTIAGSDYDAWVDGANVLALGGSVMVNKTVGGTGLPSYRGRMVAGSTTTTNITTLAAAPRLQFGVGVTTNSFYISGTNGDTYFTEDVVIEDALTVAELDTSILVVTNNITGSNVTATVGMFADLVHATNTLIIPTGAAPTVNANGELALDTTITDYTGMLKYYSDEEMTVLAVPTANLLTTDDYVVAYDADNNELYFKEDTAAAGGEGVGTVHSGGLLTVDNRIVRANGTVGTNVQSSGIAIDDSDKVEGVTAITMLLGAVTNNVPTAINVTFPPWNVSGAGAADQTAAIQAVIDYVGDLSYRVPIFFPAGIYRVDGTVNVDHTLTLVGQNSPFASAGTTILKNGTGAALNLSVQGVELRNFYINCQDNAENRIGIALMGATDASFAILDNIRVFEASVGVWCDNAWSSTLRNVIVTSCTDALIISNACSSISLENCEFSSSMNGIHFASGASAAKDTFVTGAQIQHNNMGVYGTNTYLQNPTFLSCHFEANTNYDLFLSEAMAPVVQGCIFTGLPTARTNAYFASVTNWVWIGNSYWDNTIPFSCDSGSKGGLYYSTLDGAAYGNAPVIGATDAIQLGAGGITNSTLKVTGTATIATGALGTTTVGSRTLTNNDTFLSGSFVMLTNAADSNTISIDFSKAVHYWAMTNQLYVLQTTNRPSTIGDVRTTALMLNANGMSSNVYFNTGLGWKTNMDQTIPQVITNGNVVGIIFSAWGPSETNVLLGRGIWRP